MNQLITAFNGGEVSPLLTGRTDLPAMARACRLMRGFLPGVAGGAFRRPPLLHADVAGATGARLIPFNVSTAVSYQLEVRDRALFLRKADGTGSDNLPAPWTVAQLDGLQTVQSNDVMWLVQTETPPQELQRLPASWTLKEIPWKYPPLRDENLSATTITAAPGSGNTVTLTASAPVFNPLHAGPDNTPGAFWEISHFREDSVDEIQVPVYPAASAVFTLRQQPVPGQKLALNGNEYTFRAGPVTVANEILIGADIKASRENVIAAIETTAGSPAYGPGTARNADIEAADGGDFTTDSPATGVLTIDGNPDLTPPHGESNARIRINYGSFAHEYKFDKDPGSAYEVREGATAEESLRNLVNAINLTGAGNGSDYFKGSGGGAMVAHPDVTASLTVSNKITLTAKTAGEAGNAITTVVLFDFAPAQLTFAAATLSGGATGNVAKVVLSARSKPGSDGNGITAASAQVGWLKHDGSPPAAGDTVTAGAQTYIFRSSLTGETGGVHIVSGDASATLVNLARAINGTGTRGTDYDTLVPVNAAVIAAESVDADHRLLMASKTVGASAVPLSKSSVHLSVSGAAFSDQMSAATLQGGVSFSKESAGIRIKGQWDFTTYGRWTGTVYIEQRNAFGDSQPDDPAGWDVLRKVTGRLDTNRTLSGIVEGEGVLRLRVEGMSGKEASEAPAPRFLLEAVESQVHGLVQITSVATSGLVATANVIQALYSSDPTQNWREGAFSRYRGFPSAVCLHEQRLIFSGHPGEPQKIWGSVIGDFRNFEETGLDDGSWQYQIAAQEGNPIRWIASQTGLIIGTSGDEWLMEGGDSGITPTNAQVKRQSAYGSDPVAPILAGSVVLFVQRGGMAVREYVYDYQKAGYVAPNLTEMVEHLTRQGVRALALQRAPWPVVWAVTWDGQLLACTYARESDVVAWAPQPVDGTVESVRVVYGQRGFADEVWIVVNRPVGDVPSRRLERLAPDHWQRLHGNEATGRVWHMDAASITTHGTGISHLNDRTVAILADGIEQPEQRVLGGAVSVPGASQIIVGLPQPDSRLQPMVFDIPTDTGSSRSRKYHVPEFAVRFYQTRACKYADAPGKPSFDVKLREVTDPAEAPPPLVSAQRTLSASASFNDSADLVLTSSGIHPLNVLNLIPRVQIYGS